MNECVEVLLGEGGWRVPAIAALVAECEFEMSRRALGRLAAIDGLMADLIAAGQEVAVGFAPPPADVPGELDYGVEARYARGRRRRAGRVSVGSVRRFYAALLEAEREEVGDA